MAAAFEPEDGVVYIGSGVSLSGEIYAQETVLVDGTVEGEIVCRRLVVESGGVLQGKFDVAEAEIRGQVTGDLTVKQLLAVEASARINGRWRCGEIAVARGAVLNGIAGDGQEVETQEPRSLAYFPAMEPAEVEEPTPGAIMQPIQRSEMARPNVFRRR